MFNFDPFPNIKTKSLMLRRMERADTGDLFEVRKDSRMNEHTDTKIEENTDETEVYLESYTEQKNLPSAWLLESCNFVEADRGDEARYFNDRIYQWPYIGWKDPKGCSPIISRHS